MYIIASVQNEINPDPQKNKANLPKIIIFRGRKGETETLADTLYDAGFDCDTLHGDRPQASRERIMDAFRKNKIKLLIATDVAARGLDVKVLKLLLCLNLSNQICFRSPITKFISIDSIVILFHFLQDIEYVINFDFPNNITDYVHRIGRTARANNTGTSISFLTTADERYYGELVGLLKRCNQVMDIKMHEISPCLGNNETGLQEIPPPLASYSSSRVYSGSGGDEGRYSRKSVGRSNFGRSSSNGYGGRSNSGRGGRSDYMVHRGRDDYSNNDYRSRGRGDERGRTRNLFESDYDDPRRGGKARRTAEDFEDFDH
jgi:superfamily II DNA/RNA helicase